MTSGVTAEADAPAVDWQEVVAALQGGDEWAQLMTDLEGTPGGPSVAALLRRAAAIAAAGVLCSAALDGTRGAAAGGAAGAGSGGTGRLAEAVQQVAWEKLHTGDWHTVAVVWRDAYVAACILAAASGLPGRQDDAEDAGSWLEAAASAAAGAAAGQQRGERRAEAAAAAAGGQLERQRERQGEAAVLAAALWHLDMATIMGGPLLRRLVDALIDALQRRWQALHSSAARVGKQHRQEQEQSAGQQGDEAGGQEGGEQPAAKRPRIAAGAAPAGGGAAAGDAELLPPWSLGPRGVPVATSHLPSLEAFWRDYMSTETPVVISGAMEGWPALARWADPAYLVGVAGPRTVPVEVGEHYLADRWGQQLMTLQRFVEAHVLGEAHPERQQAGQRGLPGAAAASMTAHEHRAAPAPPADDAPPQQQQAQQQQQEQQQGEQQQQEQHEAPARGYLAQHPLFDQIPALAADIREPPYCCLGEGEVQSINAWFGPAGTVTPLHTDPHPNLLCQAVGRKYVRLYPPSAGPAMYPHAAGMHTNSGRVDVDRPDLHRFPLFGQAAFQDCVLEAGQMLFIPAGWWHYVKSTTVSFSVSYWWR